MSGWQDGRWRGTIQGMASTGDSTPPPMLTVAAVARRLGVAPSTLRTWDRRYGLGPSAHLAGSHRRYGPADLARLVVMRRLTVQGVPPVDAAQIALATDVGAESAAGPVATVTPIRESRATPDESMFGVDGEGLDELDSDGAHRDRRPSGGPDGGQDLDDDSVGDLLEDDVLEELVAPGPSYPQVAVLSIPAARMPDRDPGLGGSVLPLGALRARRAGGGRVVPMPDGGAQARGLARAAMALDTHECMRLLRESVRSWGVVQTWDNMIVPVLVGIGERWRATGTGVDVEHAFSEAVLGVMRSVAASLRNPRNEHPLLLACAEGDYHTLPLHVLAAALAEESVTCRMLGVGMPAADLVAASRRCGPAAVFLYARLPVADRTVLEELPRQRPAPRVIVGGSGWDGTDLPRPVVQVSSLRQAMDELLGAVHL